MDRNVINPGLLVFVFLVVGNQPEVIFIEELQPLNVEMSVPGQDVNAVSNELVYTTVND